MFVYQFLLIIALIVSWLISSDDTITYFRSFLLVSVISELLGKCFISWYGDNSIVYNFYSILTISYYIWIFTLEDEILKKWHLYLIYGVISLLLLCILDGFHHMDFNRYNIGMILVLVLIFRYFYGLLFKSEFSSLLTLPKFWLAVGIFTFYSCLFPIFVLTSRFIVLDLDFASGIYDLVVVGNVFLVLSYLMVILCPRIIKS